MGENMETVEKPTVEIKEKPKPKPRRYYSSMRACFELGSKAVEVFKMLFKDVLGEFCHEVPFSIEMDKLVIRTMDPSRLKMANLVFPKNVFEEWRVTGKETELPVRIQVPLKDVAYAIEDSGKDAKVRFEINVTFVTTKPLIDWEYRNPPRCPKCDQPTTSNQLVLEKRARKEYKRGKGYRESYKCSCGKRFKLSVSTRKKRIIETEVDDKKSEFIVTVKEKTDDTFNIKPIEHIGDMEPLPKVSLDGRFKLMAKEFRKKLDKLQKKKDIDHVLLAGSNERLVLHGLPEYETTEVTMAIEKLSEILLDTEVRRGEKKAKFSLAEMMCVVPKTLVDVMVLDYGTDLPMRTLWHTDLNDSTLEFFLAPRIDVD